MPKVLFLGGGRRVSLAERFADVGFEVLAYETEANAPIRLEAQILPGLPWKHPDLLTDLDYLINSHEIDLVVPLQDKAVAAVAELKEAAQQEGKNWLRYPVPNKEAAQIALNKKRLEEEMLKHFPKYYPHATNDGSNLIFKPIEGANSKGIQVMNLEAAQFLSGDDPIWTTHIIQRYVKGKEYSVDAYFNRCGQMVNACVRLRQEVQGGEVSRSIIVSPEHPAWQYTKEIGEKFGMVGPTCFQYIEDERTKEVFLMEINARFGGGCILSLEAGLNMIDCLQQEYLRDHIVPVGYVQAKSGFGMIRYFSETFYQS